MATLEENAKIEAEKIFNQYYKLLSLCETTQNVGIECAMVDVQNSISALEEAGAEFNPKYVEPTLRFFEEVKSQLEKL